ncbi:MAG: peptide chain release factor N(5)-glutamine methyltransferase [Candidatus Omnitrophota bacterium]
MIAELKYTHEFLAKQNIACPMVEAEQILCSLLNCRRVDIYTSDITINEPKMHKLNKILKLRAAGEPLQYLLAKAYFYGLEFKMREGVFIPRPETEILVDAVLAHSPQPTAHSPINILDLCTGSGNIAISLTKHLQCSKICASDISQGAVATAKTNARLHGVYTNIKFRQGDLFKPWQGCKGFFDAITCNPPYIKKGRLKTLPEDVKNEPIAALDGGLDGLVFYKRIARQAVSYLKPNGYIFFEIAPDISGAVKQIFEKNFCDIEIVKDYNHFDRVITAKGK